MKRTEFSTAFGERIRDIRKKQNLSLRDFADTTGYEYSTVSGWERGDRLPDLENAVRLSQMLDVNLEYLLTGHSADSRELGRKTGLSQDALNNFAFACKEAPGLFESMFGGVGALFLWGDICDYVNKSISWAKRQKEHISVTDPDGHTMDSDWSEIYRLQAAHMVSNLVSGYINQEVKKHAQKKDDA